MFKIFGITNYLKAYRCSAGSRENMLRQLKGGQAVNVAPGGAYEAQFGGPEYKLMWRDRTGFAKVALEASEALETSVPVIPFFTANVNEAFRSLGALQTDWMRDLYLRFRLPFIPLWGGMPVKLTTFVGEPIDYDYKTCTPEELRDKCKLALEKLILKRQKSRPGSMLAALAERFA